MNTGAAMEISQTGSGRRQHSVTTTQAMARKPAGGASGTPSATPIFSMRLNSAHAKITPKNARGAGMISDCSRKRIATQCL